MHVVLVGIIDVDDVVGVVSAGLECMVGLHVHDVAGPAQPHIALTCRGGRCGRRHRVVH